MKEPNDPSRAPRDTEAPSGWAEKFIGKLGVPMTDAELLAASEPPTDDDVRNALPGVFANITSPARERPDETLPGDDLIDRLRRHITYYRATDTPLQKTVGAVFAFEDIEELIARLSSSSRAVEAHDKA